MDDFGRTPNGGCPGIASPASASHAGPCANSVTPHHIRQQQRGLRMSVKLLDLRDPARSATERVQLAAEFTHELDALFTHRTRLPRRRLREIVAGYDSLLHEQLLPELAAEGLQFVEWADLSAMERTQAHRRFHRAVYPLLTPLAVDSTHPVPRTRSLAINLGVRVGDQLVHLTMPPQVRRMLPIRAGRYLAIESVVAAALPELLVGVRIAEHAAYRITRGATTGKVSRLEVEHRASDRLVALLSSRLDVADGDVYRLSSGLAMGDAFAVEPRPAQPVPRPLAPAATRTRTEESA
ncbi:MAG: hypothetical protein ACJ74U_01110 [Jatrophihabitantaceae bacterium]